MSAPTIAPASKERLSSELKTVDLEIEAATKESALYAGGLIKTLVELRIATLKQTRAMLAQQATALGNSVSIRYTVDGRPFVLPNGSKEQLVAVMAEIATLTAKIDQQQADADRYSGGLVQAMALSTVATSKQTLAMLEQKRLSLVFGLPQYVGFAGQPTASAAQSGPPSAPVAQPSKWEIVEVDAKITESNSTWSRFAWKLTIRNTGSAPLLLEAEIEFQDKDGFVVDSDSSNRIALPPGVTETFTGYKLVTAEVVPTVSRTVAKVRQITR